uniref:Uncharacterized protein n=1 Tax=Picea sitchensis TaxID=3332 RepID=D5A995_PICSI|nr:unknown [Picea sitchensis]
MTFIIRERPSDGTCQVNHGAGLNAVALQMIVLYLVGEFFFQLPSK